tara:strand:+ start:5582 stop:5893 length:312 start_codon:yes stop_codon:yes gene_type:complete
MKKFLLFALCTIILTSCQSVQDGLTGKKRNNTDEFLVKKKNPLVQPPEFGELPTPKKVNKDEKNDEVNEIETLLKNKIEDKSSIENNTSSSVEKYILDKIKDR